MSPTALPLAPAALAVLGCLVLAPTAAAQAGSAGPGIDLVSAPVPGRPLSLRARGSTEAVLPAPFAILGSLHTDATIVVPSLGAPIRLELASVFTFASGTVAGGGTVVATRPTPANPALLGGTVDFQTLELRPRHPTLSADEAVVTFVPTVGRHALFAATSGRTLRLVTVDDDRFAAPDTAPGSYRPAALATLGPRGFAQATRNTANPAGSVSIDALDPAATWLDARSPYRIAHLPNGADFTVVRDEASPEEWLALTIDRATGTVAEVTGSRFARLPSFAGLEFGPPFGSYWGYERASSVAVGVLTYTSSTRPRPTDPSDAVVLLRTDGSAWPGIGTSTLELGTGRPDVQLVDATLVVANDRLFVWARDGTLWTAPTDGSNVLSPVALPPTGAGRGANVWATPRSARISEDGRTVVLPISADPNRRTDCDLIALTSVDRFGFVARNITAFPTPTRIEAEFGDGRTGTSYFVHLAADGRSVAFVTGFGQTAGPHRLWVAPTDGSLAGRLTPLSGIPATAPRLSTPHLFPNGAVAVFAGASPTSLDLYYAGPRTGRVRPLTTTADSALLWSLVPSFPTPDLRLVFASRRGTAANLLALDGQGSLVALSGPSAVGQPTPDLVLPVDPAAAQLRIEPLTNRLLLVARPVPVANRPNDDRIWSVDLTSPGPAVDATGGGAGPASGVRTILDWGISQQTWDLVTIEEGGLPGQAGFGARRVVAYRPTGGSVQLDRFAPGARALPGSLRVGRQEALAAWVSTTDERVWSGTTFCVAPLDDGAEGWPLLPLGRARAGYQRLEPVSAGF